MRQIMLFTTGGTIEKVYNERTGTLENRGSIVRRMLRRLRLEDTTIRIVELMHKDSLLMTDADRGVVVASVRDADTGGAAGASGIIILHGTDTLERTGRAIHEAIANPRSPIVLTGAMRPYEMKRSDALQNMTEAVFATGVLSPGVYCVAHGRALAFPDVYKDPQRGTFETRAPAHI